MSPATSVATGALMGFSVNDENLTITIFQAQISQRVGRTVGDGGLRELVGTMAQFKDAK